jgi:DNA-directed RNA polymerase specialized sigma24 family protein
MTAIDGVGAAEAADRLGIAVATVYRARHVVQTKLREAVAEMDSAEGAKR